MDRRNFIKIGAATGAGATLASCGNPDHTMIRFIPEEEIVGGVEVWKKSICPLCPAGCGMIVRVMEGEAEVVRNGKKGTIVMGLARKLEGDPDHPISQGKLCARGQAAIQVTYHPDRITHPLKRTGARGSGPYQEISWDEAIALLVSKLDELAEAGQSNGLAFLTKPSRSQRQTTIATFMRQYGGAPPVEFDPFDDEVLRHANALRFGHRQLPTFDLARARYVISFGADFLGTWNSVVSQSVGYGEMRQGNAGQRGKLVQIESRMSQTGANADEWVPVNPGTEGILALGLAHVILKSQARSLDAAGIGQYAPEEVSKRTGVKAERIERIAREFAAHSPAVAMIAGTPLGQTNGLFNALAVNELNALAGTVAFMPQPKEVPAPGIRFEKWLPSASSVKALLLHEANPVYGSPAAWRVRETLSKIPFIASFGSFIDETSILADLILPDHSFLESAVDHIPESGASAAMNSMAQAVMSPLHQTRAMTDVLLDVSRRLAKPLEMRGQSPHLIPEMGGEMGGLSPHFPKLVEAQFDGDSAKFPFHFLPYKSQAFLDGSLAHLPWLQEMPDVLSTAMWSSWLEINPETAKALGLAQGDTAEVESGHGKLQVPVLISPGIAPNIVAMPMGQGHETFTRYASGRGANPISILAPVSEPETGALAWAATRVKVTKVAGNEKLILFAGETREHANEHR